MSDLQDRQQKLEIKIASVEGEIKALDGKLEGKLAGLEGRLTQMDSTIKTIIVAYVSLLAILIGGLLTITGRVVFFSGKF